MDDIDSHGIRPAAVIATIILLWSGAAVALAIVLSGVLK